MVPRRGLEPPRLAALVPETSASTNSAIWADAEGRGCLGWAAPKSTTSRTVPGRKPPDGFRARPALAMNSGAQASRRFAMDNKTGHDLSAARAFWAATRCGRWPRRAGASRWRAAIPTGLSSCARWARSARSPSSNATSPMPIRSRAALPGADAVINLTGILFQRGQTFEDVHADGADNIAQAAAAAGRHTRWCMSRPSAPTANRDSALCPDQGRRRNARARGLSRRRHPAALHRVRAGGSASSTNSPTWRASRRPCR